jgi:hypothetical protein
MSNINPRSSSAADEAVSASPLVHPDYRYWSPIWRTIRDADIGEVEIKRNATKYLPKLQGHDNDQYRSYLSRAVFFNMTAKTLNALYGTLFRRNPKITGLPKALMEASKKLTKDGVSLHLTAKIAAKEILAMGRYGMMVDADPTGRGKPYVACYTTENILDWQMSEINGMQRLIRVVLREVFYRRKDHLSPYNYISRFRILVLNELPDGDYVYEQHIYEDRDLNGVPDYKALPDEIITPTVRGEPLNYIPFIAVGPFTNDPDVQKPPILDIVTLNLSHYQSYAQLEQGRFFTANPVYWTSGGSPNDDSGEYYVGPDVVWELGKDGSAGVIEFTGQGLTSLETALTQKENQISAIGGRMMPGTHGSAESNNALRLKEQNEQTLLMNISDTMDEAFTTVLGWWADWNNASAAVVAKIDFEMNRDFLLKDIGAREFRAIQQMYADGIIPITVVYAYLLKAEVIPDWIAEDEFIGMLNQADQFPHMVDVLAQMKNYPDAASFFNYKTQKEMLAMNLKSQEVQATANDPQTPPVPKQAMDLRNAENRGAAK